MEGSFGRRQPGEGTRLRCTVLPLEEGGGSFGRRAPGQAEQPPFDLAEMQELYEGRAELVRTALERFDQRAGSGLRAHWEAAQYRAVSRLAHQLKGTVSYICAQGAKRAAVRLQNSAIALDAAPDSDFLKSEVGEALEALEAELGRLAPAVTAARAELAAAHAAQPGMIKTEKAPIAD